MDLSAKLDKWLPAAAAAAHPGAHRPDDAAGAPGSGDEAELDAVITIHSEPEAVRAFSWRKFMLHCG